MIRQRSLLTFALLIFLVVPAFAGDLRPADYRFKPLSTVAGWDFLTDQDVYLIRPDADVPLWIGDAAEPLKDKFPAGAPYPSASVFGDVMYTPAYGGGYFADSPGENGLIFIVPNWLVSSPFKRLRLQVTYLGTQPPTTVIGYAGISGSPNTVERLTIKRVPIHGITLPPDSGFFYEDWIFSSSPTWEQVVVFIPEETILLQVVIDTVIEPPASIFDDEFEPGD